MLPRVEGARGITWRARSFSATGTVADGTLTLEESARELMVEVLAIASGKQTKAEEKGFRKIFIFKEGVVL